MDLTLQTLFIYQPYKLVIVSLTATFVFLLLIFLIKNIFPKKNIPYPLILLGFSILPLLSIFREGTYESGDLTINIAKTMSFYNALSDGQLIPRWSAELNATYGYPNFIFAYHLPYYLASFYHFIGFSFLNSVKLVLITSYITSGIAIYIFLKNHVSKKSAFLGSIFYLFAPYHLVDMHFRVNIGEMVAFIFLPLSLYFIDITVKKKGFLWNFLAGLSISFLILSHQAVSLVGLPLVFIYMLFKIAPKTFQKIVQGTFPFLLGLLFSAYYWLPALLEAKYTHQMTEIQTPIVYLKLREMLYSTWRYGLLFQGPMGELSFVLGYAHWMAIFFALYLILKGNRNKYLLFFLFLFLIYFFLTQKISKPFWDIFANLRKIQFPYRILSVIILTSSVVASFVFELKKRNWIFYFLITIAIGTSILNWGNRRNIPEIKDKQVAEKLPLMTALGEGLFPAAPIWVPKESVWQDKIPEKHLVAIDGEIEILSQKRRTIRHFYLVDAKQKGLLKENTYYFPGWELEIDGKKREILYQDQKHPGIISFIIDKGIHQIDLTFRNTSVRYYSSILSSITLLLSGLFLIINPYTKVKKI